MEPPSETWLDSVSFVSLSVLVNPLNDHQFRGDANGKERHWPLMSSHANHSRFMEVTSLEVSST